MKNTVALLVIGVVLGTRCPKLIWSQETVPTQKEGIATACHGMQLLMDGDIDGAIQVFRQVEQADPESPLGYVLEADANWWKIYLTEGNLTDPDVFEALSEKVTPYDAEFLRLNNLAIQKAQAQIHNHQDQARAYLYQGLAYALEARLEALRDHALATARAASRCVASRTRPSNWILLFTTPTWESASTTTSKPRCHLREDVAIPDPPSRRQS